MLYGSKNGLKGFVDADNAEADIGLFSQQNTNISSPFQNLSRDSNHKGMPQLVIWMCEQLDTIKTAYISVANTKSKMVKN